MNKSHQKRDATELKVTREELQSTIEQLESSNDQLRASNEEVTAANEELQSANEEMETSKEELHSLNEELNTINGRPQEKVDELEGTKNDLLNLLTSSETRLRLFIENVPIGVIRWTMDGKVQDANDRFLQMVGYSRTDLLEGRIYWSEMTPPELHQRDREAIAELNATGTNVPYEKLFIAKDGSHVPVLLSSVMIDPEYSWEGLAFVLDLTKRKQAEEQVRERAAGLAGANERLRQLSSQLLSTQEDERRRIALDIHDSLGGSLGAIKFRVQRAIHGAEGGDAASVLDALQSAIPLIQETADECRRIQMDLRPAMLDDLGILSTVSWFCRKFQRIYPGIQIEQEFGIDESEVPEFLKITIFRVTQETLNSVAKHSRADHVRFSLRRMDDRVELTIEDNGIGFDIEEVLRGPTSERGAGLSSLRERTRLSGGSFSIDSAIGKGTTVHASWALQEKR